MSVSLVVDALRAELQGVAARAGQLGLSRSEAWNGLVVVALRSILSELARARGRVEQLAGGRLFASVPGFEPDARESLRARLAAELAVVDLARPTPPWSEQPVEAFGQLYESLLAARPSDDEHSLRKRTGSYYTPASLTQLMVDRAFAALESTLGRQTFAARPLRILDPALGAGAFLTQAGRETARRSGRSLADVVRGELFGVDISPLAVAVAEASLWLLGDDPQLTLREAGTQLHEADALCAPAPATALGRRGIDIAQLVGGQSFDLVLGNPPWVAFAGRATQPLAPELRAHYRMNFRAFSGYPTLHALFVELSAQLAPAGVVALLVPSPLSDLDGYRPARGALAASHEPCEPLLELGQDAFEGVTQPCFALVAVPRTQPALEPERPFVLSERRLALAAAARVELPPALERLQRHVRFPPELFGEMGLQTTAAVTRELLYRGAAPPSEYSYALLEGRNVAEFTLGAPRLFLKPDREVLVAQRCRLREARDYLRVKLVVRQTAAIPIAAAHDGTPFRNSLLAGFELPDFPPFLTVGLLNSTLYRALHLAGRRDARQGAFPQVKVAHLRALPAPPDVAGRGDIADLAERASRVGLTPELRSALDRAVYAVFGISSAEGQELAAFVRALSPSAGLKAPLS